jgi:hypothetical protein
MKTTNDGGPAFPCPTGSDGGVAFADMSLRDWFAGMALAGIRVGDWEKCEHGAKWCYDYADAMLSERQKGQDEKTD